jgi:hypothetical protein
LRQCFHPPCCHWRSNLNTGFSFSPLKVLLCPHQGPRAAESISEQNWGNSQLALFQSERILGRRFFLLKAVNVRFSMPVHSLSNRGEFSIKTEWIVCEVYFGLRRYFELHLSDELNSRVPSCIQRSNSPAGTTSWK